MGRPARHFAEGVSVHLVKRGNNRGACFFAPDDYALFLNLLAIAAGDTGVRVHAYVLMTNHFHLLVTPSDASGPSRLVKQVAQRHSHAINRTRSRTGTLWEGRFRASMVEGDRHLLACHRYIELNPVRAGMVARPEDYPWSSHRNNIGIDHVTWLDSHAALDALSPDPVRRTELYRELFGSFDDPMAVAALRGGVDLTSGVRHVSDTGK